MREEHTVLLLGGGYGDNADSAFHLSLSLSISTSISLSLALSLPRSLHPISSRQSHRHSRPIDFRGCRRRVARSELSLSRTRLSLDASVDRMSVLHDRRVPDRHRRSNLLYHLKPFWQDGQSNKTADIKPCERTWFKHESISVGL